MNEQFLKDLKEKGEPAQEAFLKILRAKFDKDAHQIEGYFKEYDILCPNLKRTYEVKCVKDAIINVPIEFKVTGKESGILTTTADYWAIFAKERFYVIKTSVLKRIIKKLPLQTYYIHGRKNELKILPINTLYENSYVYK